MFYIALRFLCPWHLSLFGPFVLFEHFQAAEIERRIARETKAEEHIHKLLLLGMLDVYFFIIYIDILNI